MDNSEMLEVAFVEQTMQSTQGCEGLATLKSGVTFNEDANAWDIQQTKQMLE
jgi:hypothetical protein